MIKINDGPAEGKGLLLKRAPRYLRITVDAAGEVDALDQKNDAPRPDEKIYAYTMVEGTYFSGFACGSSIESGYFVSAEYTICKEQPKDAVMRNLRRWERWVEKHHAANMS